MGGRQLPPAPNERGARMGYTHFDQVSGINGVAVGAKGSEVAIASSTGGLSQAGTAINATGAEINNAADVSGRVQIMTVDGAVTPGVQSVELNATGAIAATIATSVAHQGLFIVKAFLEPATTHTVTLTAGTWDGTNTIATFTDILDTLVVYFDSAGGGTIVENVGAVGLS